MPKSLLARQKARLRRKINRGTGLTHAQKLKNFRDNELNAGLPIAPPIMERNLLRGVGRYRRGPGQIMGRGGFWTDAWNAGRRFIPRAVGGGIGYLTGGLSGARTGWGMGGNFSKNVLGWGAYGVPWTIKNNSLTGDAMVNSLVSDGSMPRMGGGSDHVTDIKYSEPLCGVYGSQTYSVATFEMNPAMQSTFDWLANVAANYQQYQLLGAVLVYKPLMGDISTATTLGEVMLAFEENPSAAVPINQNAMKSMQFCASDKPSRPIVAPIECAIDSSLVGSGSLYTRTGSIPTGSVIQSYDRGKILIGTYGQPAALAGQLMGNVYCCYHFKLLSPQASIGNNIMYFYSHQTGLASASPFGTSWTTHVDTFGGTVVTATTITLPPNNQGTYFLINAWANVSGAVTSAQYTYTNATANLVFQSGSPGAGETVTSGCTVYTFNIVDPALSTVITAGGCTLPVGAASSNLVITQVGAGFHS